MKRFWFSCATAACLVAAPLVAAAQQVAPMAPPVAPVQEVTSKHVGVGYKIGNGLGFVGGDVIIAPTDRLSIDLQVGRLSTSAGDTTATGFGVAPAVQFRFNDSPGSSPYMGLGYLYAQITLNQATAHVQGVFLNGGYEWRWANGLGLLLGGGFNYLGTLEATDGVVVVKRKAQLVPEIEFGFRFLFL